MGRNKYQLQASLGLFSLFLTASPLFLKLPAQYQAFNKNSEMEVDAAIAFSKTRTSEQIERERIQQRKETADTLQRTGILPTHQKLKIRRYFDNPKRNPNPDITGYLEDETVFVYDSAGICIGRIESRQWYWKHWYKNACDNSPAQ
ncbi:hypothetical protein [Calothrix sp. UHCC 0171]|uniref:hypothetical protein n=1 Tax=Calothrix sp. UHCC 0171 TaxID=3110245 RepID=UPI002B1F1217|nr:hypothetical protein [Calothrix sp. UHCC 0171]MEA5574171.1 hypothetical protein [Calothrix sp. UHCC 0171]